MFLDKKDKSIILSQVDWEKLRNKTLFLTGATGFIGRNILDVLLFANTELKLNLSIFCLIRKNSQLDNFTPEQRTYLSFVTGDLDSLKWLPIHFDYVIHGAQTADSKFSVQNPVTTLNTAISTKNLLNCLMGSNLRGFLYLSSGVVKDKREEFNAYRESKKAAESICNAYQSQYGIPIKIARIFAVMGPYMNLNSSFAITNFIKAKRDGETLSANYNVFRSYLYSADLVVWLLKILIDGESNSSYDIGSSRVVSVFELAKLFSPDVKKQESEIARNAGNIYLPDTRRANELGLKENYTLEEMVDRTYKFYAKMD